MTRLDRALVDRGVIRSRSRAAREIAAGHVCVNGRPVTKSSTPVADTDELRVAEADPWVARSAHKLLGAFDSFAIGDLAGITALDAGASTGGFTQVLLSRHVAQVWAVDVGHGQFDPQLRDDSRVQVREGLNLRVLRDSDVPDVDLVVADVSFISLRLLLAELLAATKPTGELLLMVKPQFELARSALDKHGVVTNPAARRRALDSVVAAIAEADARVVDAAASVLPGPSGNIEYFLRVRPGSAAVDSDRLEPADLPGHLTTIMKGES